MFIMAHNNLIMLMAVLFPCEEDIIHTNTEGGHLLVPPLMYIDIQIDNIACSFTTV